MSARVVHLEVDAHQAVQALLPWYLSQTLEGDELAQVRAHLAECPRCQAELEVERQLRAANASLSEAGDVERSLAALRMQIQAPGPTRRLASRWRRLREGWRSELPWLRWAVALQFVLLLGLGTVLLLPQAPADRYRGLGTTSHAAAGNLLVRFKADASERELRQALKDAGARVVDGPTVTDAYLLSVPPEHQAEALLRLRAQPIVVLAESLDAGAGR